MLQQKDENARSPHEDRAFSSSHPLVRATSGPQLRGWCHPNKCILWRSRLENQDQKKDDQDEKNCSSTDIHVLLLYFRASVLHHSPVTQQRRDAVNKSRNYANM